MVYKLYTAERCSGCQLVKPHVLTASLPIYIHDIDRHGKEPLVALGVRSIPCLVSGDGKVVLVGAEAIIKFLKGE